MRTGATAIIPHTDDIYRFPVPAGHHVGNGCGNMMGTTQIDEFGELETPIMLTNTLSVQMVNFFYVCVVACVVCAFGFLVLFFYF